MVSVGKLARRLRALLRGEDGAAAVEYALLASLISLAIIQAVQAMGEAASRTFETVANAL